MLVSTVLYSGISSPTLVSTVLYSGTYCIVYILNHAGQHCPILRYILYILNHAGQHCPLFSSVQFSSVADTGPATHAQIVLKLAGSISVSPIQG